MNDKNENTPTEQEAPAQTGEVAETPRGFSNKRNILIIAIALVVLIIGGAMTAVAVTRSGTQSSQSIMTLAERYLKEEKYEQAVIEFQRVIELDPMNVDAYLNLAEAYIGLGNTEKALEVLRQGLEATGDSRLQDMIDELTKPAESSSAAVSSSEPTTSKPIEVSREAVRISRYDGKNRLEYESVNKDGIETNTYYGDLYDDNDNYIGWGISSIYQYRRNKNGKWLNISRYRQKSEQNIEYYYNENDELEKTIVTYTNHYLGYDENYDSIYGKCVRTYTYVYEYGEFGVAKGIETCTYPHIKKGVVNDETSVYTTVYKYDSSGNCISEYKTSDNEKSITSSEYEYDDKGRRLKYHYKHSYDGELKNETIETRKYNENGTQIYYRRDLDSKGNVTEETNNYTYNENGYVIEHTDTDSAGTRKYVTTVVKETDEYGRVITSTEYNEDGSVLSKTIYEYELLEEGQ